ncbi:MAG: ATP phosphoribosyltransferase [Planctomycetota bacterium]
MTTTAQNQQAISDLTSPLAPLNLALPKGRMRDSLWSLLADAGIRVRESSRGYRPGVSLANCSTKILKPQNTIEMLAHGSRDIGFAGRDWVHELGVEDKLVEVLDLGLDPVRIVAAAPRSLLVDGKLPDRPLVIASELENLTRKWIVDRGLDAEFVRAYGATEVFPPEDADCIVDITQTGATLEANNLAIIDDLLTSSTRMYASRQAMDDPGRRARIDDLVLLLSGVLEARSRVMLDLNVSAENLEAVISILPCMREPTVSSLRSGGGHAVRAAVPERELTTVVPALKAAGATDIVVTNPSQIVP